MSRNLLHLWNDINYGRTKRNSIVYNDSYCRDLEYSVDIGTGQGLAAITTSSVGLYYFRISINCFIAAYFPAAQVQKKFATNFLYPLKISLNFLVGQWY
jgi:hypothetical protein